MAKIVCKECFFDAFESEVHATIVAHSLFTRGMRVAIGASGGKDSTVLAYVLKVLNEKYDYGLDLFLLSIDEGITGYRDDSLETVKQNKVDYGMDLRILSYADLYGWSMDDVVAQIGLKNNCTFCGVFRRQALDRGALLEQADCIVTGHNADDMAETVLMNILRGDISRLGRCVSIVTSGSSDNFVPRCKPLKYCYEKEIVLYAYYKDLVYFSTECIYSPNAYRGFARQYLKDLERVRPSAIIDIIRAAEHLVVPTAATNAANLTECSRCNYITSGFARDGLCQACVLLDGLNAGRDAKAAATAAAAPALPLSLDADHAPEPHTGIVADNTADDPAHPSPSTAHPSSASS
ncbi:cytoplasmic tRNA 2-thiolation protein 1 [Thecamonas trahens ATCC 50062]|uniref:Cytoplasmic tRNA 2-thiolation protein 1 n=1 Tax=Thecamonas trahens ATCC 50062 TaxID=461836 RepID=A0A0L0D7P7_THETB|nr:cytoplasmic tRNA 2-thiolation protein 1 [Thecamonas trahens ATCC 50062]KNC48076.1 cytoplasmic tRNA 2-thiolation protein 1 [Thecamonas trahens ATCC 50062]|eukprot:XP_013759091.1 cytoplasmic tRNA 2-thiolation protein 1 [Thecamonas trahens ATCC 50062]